MLLLLALSMALLAATCASDDEKATPRPAAGTPTENEVTSPAAPGEGAGDLVLEPLSDPRLGFSTVVPADWDELIPGFYARGNPEEDPTILAEVAAPSDEADVTVGEILASLGADSLPDTPDRTIDSDLLTWTLYLIPGDPMGAVALAETEATTYVVAMQVDAAEFGALADELLIPVLMALAPIE